MYLMTKLIRIRGNAVITNLLLWMSFISATVVYIIFLTLHRHNIITQDSNSKELSSLFIFFSCTVPHMNSDDHPSPQLHTFYNSNQFQTPTISSCPCSDIHEHKLVSYVSRFLHLDLPSILLGCVSSYRQSFVNYVSQIFQHFSKS